VYRPRALLFRGRVEWMRGRAWTARSLWRQSLERSDALVAAQGPIAQGDEPFMFDRALALAALGREETDHVLRGELLRRALTLFSRCRMPCFEEQVQMLLAAMPAAAEVHV
jgi:hypothetical protein